MWDILNKLFGGWKNWGVTVFLASLVASLWNKVVEFILFLFNYAMGKISAVAMPDAVSVNMDGFAAWMAIHLKFAECLTVIFFAVMTKWILRKIPFIRW